jgi:hypothetical protein
VAHLEVELNRSKAEVAHAQLQYRKELQSHGRLKDQLQAHVSELYRRSEEMDHLRSNLLQSQKAVKRLKVEAERSQKEVYQLPYINPH